MQPAMAHTKTASGFARPPLLGQREERPVRREQGERDGHRDRRVTRRPAGNLSPRQLATVAEHSGLRLVEVAVVEHQPGDSS